MQVDVTNKTEQRKFGVVMAVAFAVLGAIRWWIKGETTGVLFVVAALFLVAGLAMPRTLQPVFRAWMALAEVLNAIMTRLLLGIVFFGMIVPGRLIWTVLGRDPLNRRLDPEALSYWEEPEDQPDDPESYLNQY
jgi:hypothetical protein